MSHTICSTAHVGNMQQTVWQTVIIQLLYLKLKTKDFLYLPGMDSTNMK